MEPNIGWKFYREYFSVLDFLEGIEDDDIHKQELELRTRKLTSFSFQKLQQHSSTLSLPHNLDSFTLVTTYPGLLIGSGYTHETGLTGELKLGFFFDHTTGLPVIPGSSVKGVLRSVFPNSDNERNKDRVEFVRWLIQEANEHLEKHPDERLEKIYTNVDIDALEFAIFEGKRRKNGGKSDEWEYYQSTYQRDIFYDACILKSDHTPPGKQADNCFLGNDYITPHKHTGNPRRTELDSLSNPIPIQFLKILPNVTFCFQFRLNDIGLPAKQKLLLFRHILLTLGIGAKTNVGYGQFRE